jgi:hypothetical protein
MGDSIMSSIIRATTTSGLQIAPDNSGSLQLQTNGTTTAVTIDTSQNVGIGTTTMTGKFNVSAGRSFFAANSEQYSIGVGYNQSRVSTGAQVYYIGATDSATPALVFSEAGGAEKMRIDSGGNVQVGMTAGTYRLNVKYTDNNQLWLDNDGSTSTGMVYANNGTSKVQLYWHNSLARYYITAVSAGVFLASGGTSWTSASDERVKDIIEPIENATAKLANWRTVIGKYKADEEGTRRSFLIAQDVQTTFPEAVDTTNAEEFGLRYQDTIPVLVKAIQEQQTIINDLKARIETLEAK